MRNTPYLFLIACTGTLVLAAAGCDNHPATSSDENSKFKLPDSLAKTITIDSVVTSRVVNALTLTGKVAFNEDNVVKIFSIVSGNLQDIKVMLGDYVQKGKQLAVIKSSEMAGINSDVITAETNLKVAKKSLEASTDMYKSGLLSAKDLLAAQAAYDQAAAALEKAHRILQINGGSRTGDFIVKAPISGFVVEKLVTNNMAIRSDNGSNLFTISDLKNVWVIANVYESNIPNIKAGDVVNVTTISYPGKIFKGKVDKVMNVLDPTNKVMKVRIVLANPGYLLKPEMFANVTVTNSVNQQMLSIPSKALIFDHSQYYVLVYKSPTDISIRPVQIASNNGDITYITNGLKEGEKIISSKALLIYQELNS